MESLEAQRHNGIEDLLQPLLEVVNEKFIEMEARHERDLKELHAKINRLGCPNAQVSSSFQTLIEIQTAAQLEVEARFSEIQARHDKDFKELKAKIDHVSSNFEYLDGQVSRLVSSLRSTTSVVESSSKGHCHAISVSHEDDGVGSGIKNTHRKQMEKNDNSFVGLNIKEDNSCKVDGNLKDVVPTVKKTKKSRKKRIRQDQVEMVKHVLKVDTKVEKAKLHVVPEATTPKSKKKKLEEAKSVSHEACHPSLTFEPLRFIDGKIECKVVCKGRSKPFAKARILIPPDSKTNDVGVITDPTALAFNIKLDDRGPYHEVPLQFPYI